MRFHIHIGTPKSGTTSVQRFLHDHAKALDTHGIAYVEWSLPHLPHRPGTISPDNIPARISAAKTRGITNMILSDERLIYASPAELTHICDLLDTCQITLVACLRHWTNLWPSRWMQNVRLGDTQSFPAFHDQSRATGHTAPSLHYAALLARLTALPRADLKVVSFDNARDTDGVLPTLLQALGVPRDLAASDTAQSFRTNSSFSPADADLCRIVNGIASMATGDRPNAAFDDINADTLPLQRQLNRRHLPALRQRFRADTAAVEAQIAAHRRTITLHHDDPLFANWTAQVAGLAASLTVNPIGGRIFAKPQDRTVTASTLEVHQIPPETRDRIARALHRLNTESPLSRKAGRLRARILHRFR